jgi:hypothetical protein
MDERSFQPVVLAPKLSSRIHFSLAVRVFRITPEKSDYRKLAHHAPASHESLSLGGEIDNNKRLLSETQISRQLSPGVSFISSSLRRILEIQIEFEPSLARNPVTVTPSPGLRVLLLHPERMR